MGVEREAWVDPDLAERPAYLDIPGARLYTVLHAARPPRRALLLLVPPFGAERERAYPCGVRWARRLAAAGVETLRFDLRGVGESEGDFASMSFGEWAEDVAAAARALRRLDPERPLILHGLRLGGLLAAERFAEGVGDGLLLWSPPASAREHLRELLRRNVSVEMTLRPERPPTPREAYVAELEAGGSVSVDGYRWTSRLWRDAEKLALKIPEGRPALRLDARGPGRFWESSMRLLPDTAELFAASERWILGSFP